MSTLAAWLLWSAAIAALYAAVVGTLTSRRVALNGAAGDTPLYTETVDATGIDPERQP